MNMDSSTVYARGVPDSAGVEKGTPVFKRLTNSEWTLAGNNSRLGAGSSFTIDASSRLTAAGSGTLGQAAVSIGGVLELDASEGTEWNLSNRLSDDGTDAGELVTSREEQILSRIKDEDLMKYLEMEHERLEMMQSIKEAREKRVFTMLQLLISLAAIVIVVFLLRDNPTVLVNILYIVGIIIVLWILKGPHEKNPFKKE